MMGDTYDDYESLASEHMERAIHHLQNENARLTADYKVAFSEIERLQAENARLANQLINEIPGTYIEMKERALSAEATIERITERLDAVDYAHWAPTHQFDAYVPTSLIRSEINGS